MARRKTTKSRFAFLRPTLNIIPKLAAVALLGILFYEVHTLSSQLTRVQQDLGAHKAYQIERDKEIDRTFEVISQAIIKLIMGGGHGI